MNSHVCNAWLMNIQSQTTTTNVVELQLQHRYYPIQPHSGVAGSLAVRFHGLHPWLFTLNPAGSIRREKNREAIKYE
jgi:hypothetical protein